MRYLGGISEALVHWVEPEEGSFPQLNPLSYDFCTECGSVVYRTDLHDRWHDEFEKLYVSH